MKRAFSIVERVLHGICCVLLLIMVFCALTQVTCRFILKIPCVWTEEYAKMSFLSLTLLMWPVLESTDTQLKVTYFFNKMHRIPKTILFFVINTLYLAFIVLFFASALRACIISWNLVYSAIKWLNAGVQYIPALVAMPFAFIFVVLRMFNYKEELRKHTEYDLDEEEE